MKIALVGAPGSGKSSIGDALCGETGAKLSFAAGVKEEVAEVIQPFVRGYVERGILAGVDKLLELMGMPPGLMKADFIPGGYPEGFIVEDMNDPEVKDGFRTLLQMWGTEFRRAQDPDYWVKRAQTKLARLVAEGFDPIVIDDCRFPNEYAMLKSEGFHFVRLESGPTTRPLTGAQAEHESERYWPSFNVDLVLDFQEGPEVQAERIVKALGE